MLFLSGQFTGIRAPASAADSACHGICKRRSGPQPSAGRVVPAGFTAQRSGRTGCPAPCRRGRTRRRERSALPEGHGGQGRW